MTGWVDGNMLSFDLETTGVDCEKDLVLTSALVNIVRHNNRPDFPLYSVKISDDYLDHGLQDPIPGSEVHKLRAADLAGKGNPAETLDAICQVIAAVVSPDHPLVGMNLAFDLTMLDRNCRRLGVTPLTDRCQLYCVDLFVLDKLVDPYRKGAGRRKLEILAKEIYRVPWDEDTAHSSSADALAAARCLYRLGRLYPPVGALGAAVIHELQIAWKAAQDESFAQYLRKQGKPTEGVDGQWPIRSL